MQNKIFIPKDKNLLDPKVDSTFKSMFTQEKTKSKNALKKFISYSCSFRFWLWMRMRQERFLWR